MIKKNRMQNLKKTYSQLPEEFHKSTNPTPVSKPKIICLNRSLANDLSIDTNDETQFLQYFSGNELPANSSPIAMAYAGHQFGNFVPQLGDGRAILLGELFDKKGKHFVYDEIVSKNFKLIKKKKTIAIAGGVQKASAIRSTLLNGCLFGLITDEEAAKHILNEQ